MNNIDSIFILVCLLYIFIYISFSQTSIYKKIGLKINERESLFYGWTKKFKLNIAHYIDISMSRKNFLLHERVCNDNLYFISNAHMKKDYVHPFITMSVSSSPFSFSSSGDSFLFELVSFFESQFWYF